MPGIFVAPDRQWRTVDITGSFDVDADMPDATVRNRVFPEKARAFVEQMGKRGYRHDGGKVWLYRKHYAVTETNDDDTPAVGVYEHREERRERVTRKMRARFYALDRIVNKEQVMEDRRGITND
jgi:hypothetical protein